MNMRLVLAILLSAGLAACGGGGSSAGGSSGGGTTTGTVPAAPTGLTALAKDSYVLLDANQSTDTTITGYNVYWSTTSGVSKTSPNKFAVGATPQAHTGLANGQPYYYVITSVNPAGESAASAQATATPASAPAVADTLFGDQWHLKNTGQLGAKVNEDMNTEPARLAGYTGAGVRIAIVDDGIEMAHEDLASNMGANGLSHNYVTGSSDPTYDPADKTSGHGTECAGIAAARDMNTVGGRGVAPRATLVGYNATQTARDTDISDAMVRNKADVSISSNSWGATDGTAEFSNKYATPTWKSAITTGLNTGRVVGGSAKGIIYMWAAGNGGGIKDAAMPTALVDNSNYDGQANYRGVMAVAAVDDQGVQAPYSEPGANLWVSAPGGKWCDTHTITTTDRTGDVGSNTAATAGKLVNGATDYTDQNYTKCMNGTSSATPGAAGVVALMLQANPNLTWRDVRIILAQTSRLNDQGTCTSGAVPCPSTTTGWILNGLASYTAANQRYYFHHKYGFGVVDANAAVAAATAYTSYLSAAEKTYSATSSPAKTIVDSTATLTMGVPTTDIITVPSNSGISSIEWVEVTVTATAPMTGTFYYSGDYDVKLTSPSGMVSQLAVQHYCKNVNGSCVSTYNGWVFGSAAHLGEVATGSWTLTMTDADGGGGNGKLDSWTLKLYGH